MVDKIGITEGFVGKAGFVEGLLGRPKVGFIEGFAGKLWLVGGLTDEGADVDGAELTFCGQVEVTMHVSSACMAPHC